MGYRRHISDITESLATVTFALVVRDETNVRFTFGGGYVTLLKPIRVAELDTAVQKIIDEGDLAFPKKLTEQDRAALNAIPATVESRRLTEFARLKNLVDWPGIGKRH